MGGRAHLVFLCENDEKDSECGKHDAGPKIFGVFNFHDKWGAPGHSGADAPECPAS